MATAAPTIVKDASSERTTGPTIITGKLTYTNAFFTAGVAQPLIILEDQGGFITRNRKYVIPVESQVIGEITSDFYQSPFTYSLSLPAEPNGSLHDVDHDGKEETGVMVFAVAYWTNTWGDPYLERRDQGGGGWSSAYASTKVNDNPDMYLEVFGGKYLVYAPDGEQQFPSGFGADKKLFTGDDPVQDLPAGWSVIDLDKEPFAIDRSAEPVIDLLEPESTAMDDFSSLSYTEAFDKMLEKFTKEYAWTELKKIDWAAKAGEFRPRFEAAQANNDKHAYALALRDFLWSVPDTHVGFDQSLLNADFQQETGGGVGFAMRETDDGKFIANYILAGGPAEKAGMKWGAEILTLDGKPTAKVVENTIPWSSPFSNPTIKRLQQLRYALRFSLDKGQLEVRFKNPGGSEQSAALQVVGERDSFNFSSFRAGQSPTVLPVEYELLPSGYGYIKITSFLDNDVLSIQIWERAIRFFNENGIPGIILDMRTNTGGSGWLANQMAAYFFDQETVVGNSARYNKATDSFYMDPGDEARMIPPPADLRYSGPVAVMVGPGCISACEFFSYDLTVDQRAAIVGQYSSEGAGGSVEQFLMPENLSVQMTIGRAVDAQGKVHLEGTGVEPTVVVPVTAEILQKQANGEDVVLDAAVNVLRTGSLQGAGVTPAGNPTIAGKSDAEKALRSGTPFLEDKAREKPGAAEISKPGKVTYTVPLTGTEPVVWAYFWCAKDADTLKQNLNSIKLKFMLNGEDVSGQMNTMDLPVNNQQCRLVYTMLSDWPGGEHHLSTTATFTASINDGQADYPAGDYILDYAVFVKP
jgi:C-terminal processing protease CtpA/Prc